MSDIIDENEYFYQRKSHTSDQQQTQSSNSSITSKDSHIGEPDEFEKLNQYYQQRHSVQS